MAGQSGKAAAAANWALLREGAVTYAYVLLWIALSATVIMFNKYLLTYAGFQFPITLTMWHMLFCSVAAAAVVRLGYVAPSEGMNQEVYTRAIVPIGALFSVNLWLGNTAYMYLSVSFAQMLMALMPASVFIVGMLLGTETWHIGTATNMVVVTAGVAVASYGEVNFVVIGVVAQVVAILAEATRLSLLQVLLQKRGLRLNPVTTLYYVAPCCLGFLLLPWALLEAPRLLASGEPLALDPVLLLSNAVAAFALNMSVFLLIGRTSALTMNIGGVIKDWLLIGLSIAMYRSPVSRLNLAGYFVAFLSVCYYNFTKISAAHQQAQQQATAKARGGIGRTSAGEEGLPLVERRGSDVHP